MKTNLQKHKINFTNWAKISAIDDHEETNNEKKAEEEASAKKKAEEEEGAVVEAEATAAVPSLSSLYHHWLLHRERSCTNPLREQTAAATQRHG